MPRLIQKHDERPRPGDLVLVRGSQTIDVYAWEDANVPRSLTRIAKVIPGMMGVVLSTPCPVPTFTYVLWSCPSVSGMVQDGRLRKV